MSRVELEIRYSPRAWQRECHTRRARFFVYIAPFLKQAKAIAWERIKQKLAPLIPFARVEVSEAELSIRFTHNNATIRLFGGDNPDALRGVRLDGVVIDEVAQIKPEVWNDIIQPALSDRKGWAMFIGTPAGINLFSELFYGAERRDDWYAARYTVHDTDALDPDEVKRLKRDMPEQAFAREYLCDFSAAGDDQLISLSDAEEAARRRYGDSDILMSPVVVGVDPARFGDDRSVIIIRQGLQAQTPTIYRGIDNMQLAAAVANLIEDRDPDAVFIDAGAGAGVIDRLRQLGYAVTEVPFGGKATEPGLFINRRTEMWWAMREWLQSGGAIPNDMSLKAELSTPTYWFDSVGRRCLESKDEIKKRLQGGGSPDIADALCLTFAYPVATQLPREVRDRLVGGTQEYDPYAEV